MFGLISNVSTKLPLPMQIMSHLLADVTIDAHLSLQPLLHLAAVLSRDLQQDYLPLLPRLLGRVGRSDTSHAMRSLMLGNHIASTTMPN
jgi:hypothetical protein